uniref:Lipocalin/cytosolic fatty-acid binding domain-containing protein n=1 Tax=Riptortus pedestris TaxID=329032 RepID=R4WQA7_RIPPE|nr:unknown secreted protein [Riptortus pedestris]
MRAFALFLTLLCMYAAVEGRRRFGNCPKVKKTDFKFKEAKGTWYAYAVNPSRWVEKCQQYFIYQDDNNDFRVEETFVNDYKLFSTTTKNSYYLEYDLASPKFSLKKTYVKYISLSDTWTVIDSDPEFSSFMILYKCGPTLPWYQKEEITVWVKKPELVDGKPVPEDIVKAITDAGFSLNELQIKKETDCKNSK